MNIGIVCYPTYGGSGVMATELGLALADRGHQVHFITYQRPARLNHFQKNVFYHEVNAMEYPLFEFSPYESALTSKLVDVAQYEKLDLIHVHYAVPHASVACMAQRILEAKNITLPIITTLHGTDITLVGDDPSYKPVVEFGINNSNAVTAVSHFLKDATYKNFQIDSNMSIKVIYNFIDLQRFRKIDRTRFKCLLAPNKEFVITHVSNFRKVKRTQDVIKIFAKIREKHPALLLMIGDGPERQNIESLSRKLNLKSSIKFLGKQDAVEELLSISDLFLLPSKNESFGLVALEAMACEVPVISSNVGGLPEVIEDGKTGYLEKVGDVESMAQKALKLLENPELLKEMKKNAYARAQQFNISQIVTQYEDLYEEVYSQST